MTVKTRKKLIEVALPLEAINVASAREKSIRHGHPSTLHLWWARRPLAAARAVIFAQMVDDPSAWPERFLTEDAQDVERQRLFRIIEQLVLWENTTNEDVLEQARAEIRRSWLDACEDNREHPRALELFQSERLPDFHDPFAGGGALPLEAQRLGLQAWASDLNPVAALINKAMIEIPPKFSGLPPVGPPPTDEDARISVGSWEGATGLAEDVRRYGAWIHAEAQRRIGHLYPRAAVTDHMLFERGDLKPYAGRELTVIAWLWARTVKSPNPAFAHVDVPLVSTFTLSRKKGKEAWVEPVVRSDGTGYDFVVRFGSAAGVAGTVNRGGGTCFMSGAAMPFAYLRREAKAGRMGKRLMAVVAQGDRGRVYLSPIEGHLEAATCASPSWRPDVEISHWPGRTNVVEYGMTTFGDLFTDRQLVALTTLADLVQEARVRVKLDATAAGMPHDERGLDEGGTGATAYADAVALYLGFAVSKTSNRASTLCTFKITVECPGDTFGRQALPMSWDFSEANTVGGPSGSFESMVKNTVAGLLANATSPLSVGHAVQLDASTQSLSAAKLVSTDPPYYDNIGYADLSDFFYVWLRRALKPVFPDLFSTLAVPKAEELVASPYRHGSKEKAEVFFLNGMTEAMLRLSGQAHPAFPTTIFYAFKQSESDTGGTASTGWETFLDALLHAGFAIGGTWPMRTERENRKINQGANALATSVVLVCRSRDVHAPIATRREFLAALQLELPHAVRHLQHGNIAPVDLAQAAIGPGMGVYTRYAKVIDADGSPLSVRDALALINQALDQVLAEQEGDFDPDTRWALAWFDQYGFAEGSFGDADNLSRAKGTSVEGMVEAGIVQSGRGKVRLLRPDELAVDWDPARDRRLTVWEATHHLLRTLDHGEQLAADLAWRLGGFAETARDLAYRLYVLCERKKRAQEALAYNALVQSWAEIQRLAAATSGEPVQGVLEI